jgi:hypothetical protein
MSSMKVREKTNEHDSGRAHRRAPSRESRARACAPTIARALGLSTIGDVAATRRHVGRIPRRTATDDEMITHE